LDAEGTHHIVNYVPIKNEKGKVAVVAQFESDVTRLVNVQKNRRPASKKSAAGTGAKFAGRGVACTRERLRLTWKSLKLHWKPKPERVRSLNVQMHRRKHKTNVDKLMEKFKEANEQEMKIREKVFRYTTIFSESDPYRTITYVNNNLCEVSKYSRRN
jgi:hypothetical protein